MTSGGDQIFPKGITVGTVMKVSPGADLFLNIRVKPTGNLNQLEEVLVITKKEDRAPSLADTNTVRAVDILTQRLPSVPDKPAATPTQAPAAGTGRHRGETSQPLLPSLRSRVEIRQLDRRRRQLRRVADFQAGQAPRRRERAAASEPGNDRRTNLTSVPITYTSQDQVEVYRFSPPVAIAVPLVALFLQAFLPLRLHFFSLFDLPLLVVIFFAVARRSPVAGLLTGSLIGLLQDSLTHQPIGIYGIAKTVVGFGASSLGAKAGCRQRRRPFPGDPVFLRGSRDRVLHGGARPGETDPGVELGTRNRRRPCSTPRPRQSCSLCWTGSSREREQSSVVGRQSSAKRRSWPLVVGVHHQGRSY